ncbi:MAG: RNA polymerase sigma factor region1.1 domain-containing protein, partial [Pseudomonadota bacterium]
MATSASAAQTAKGNRDEASQDAPLIDMSGAAIKKMIAKAKERGVISYDELNSALPQDQMTSEQIEDVMTMLSEMGISVVDSEEAEEAERADEKSQEKFEVSQKSDVDRTDDPVRMYLREMGSVELLSREGEIAIAKRIEAGRETMIAGLCESPMTFEAIIDWYNRFDSGEMLLREIIDLEATMGKGPGNEEAADRMIGDGSMNEPPEPGSDPRNRNRPQVATPAAPTDEEKDA